jgi:hypothetical protein
MVLRKNSFKNTFLELFSKSAFLGYNQGHVGVSHSKLAGDSTEIKKWI